MYDDSCAAGLLVEGPKRERRWWIKPWIAKRSQKGNFSLVNEELRVEDKECYKNFLRMDEKTFDMLLNLIKDKIMRQNTNMRECISAKQMLTVTLRFLATGETYRSLMYSFRISESTISLFVPLVCEAIYQELKEKYLKEPATTTEWLNISREFEERWNLPNVVGAMDGKHIIFQAPRSAGSTYYNYKGTHSIVLLAVVDADCKFLYVDVGTNGRVSDGGVYRKSQICSAIEQNKLNFPQDKQLPGRTKKVPYVVVTDAAFPLSQNILKPYPFRNMTKEQRIFNYRLSRARNVVENAFGILSNRFRVLLTKINLSPTKVEIIALACCALHNFLKMESASDYTIRTSEDEADTSFSFAHALSYQDGNRPKAAALAIRQEFMEFVNREGRVTWQDRK